MNTFEVILSTVLIKFCVTFCDGYLHPDFGLDEKQLIKKHGYPLEVHTARTDDDYLLELHRIPHGRDDNDAKFRPAVLLVPGIISSSSTFLYFGPESGLAYLLADNGYDVWMGNNRGTTWSKGHVYLNSSTHNEKYWSFSHQELGASDTPAFIDYILNVTKQENLFYVGYSQGTTVFFIMMSEKPEYNKKVRLMVSISTSLDLSNSQTVFRGFSAFINDLIYISTQNNYYGIMPRSETLTNMAQDMCNVDAKLHSMCFQLFCSFIGFTKQQLNKTLIPLFLTNSPNGVSLQQVLHSKYLLLGKLQKFDFGPEENLKKYGQLDPPKYKLYKTVAPVAIYHGTEDKLVMPKHLDKLDGVIPNIVLKKLIPEFGHLDVMWGIDAPKMVFQDIIKLFKSFV